MKKIKFYLTDKTKRICSGLGYTQNLQVWVKIYYGKNKIRRKEWDNPYDSGIRKSSNIMRFKVDVIEATISPHVSA